MILISHRGNLNGPNKRFENSPDYIDESIKEGFDAEIDIWVENENLFLGHDQPQYNIKIQWIENRANNLWIHCKNVDAVIFFLKHNNGNLHYFFHQNDDITLTSKNFIWAYPGLQPINSSIAVLPEINNEEIKYCIGVCSDFINDYRQKNI